MVMIEPPETGLIAMVNIYKTEKKSLSRLHAYIDLDKSETP